MYQPTHLSYCVTWSKGLLFMLKYDEINMPYQVFIDRHGRCLIILDVRSFYEAQKKPKE